LVLQRAALQWVRTNIKAFGGDPTKVTLFGQSAGASSTSVHVVSPLSKGLFRSAIIESNPWTLPLKKLDTMRKLGERFVDDVGCTERDGATAELACLRNVSTATILTMQKKAEKHIPIGRPLDLFMPWVPNVDGIEMTDQPRELLRQGKWNKVPLMTGTVSNEALLFIWQADKSPMDGAEYLAVGTFVFHEDVLKVLKYYPNKPLRPSDGTDRRSRLATVGTDYIFACPERYMLRGLVNTTGDDFPIYRYQFQHHLKADVWGPRYAECDDPDYVCHGTELPFVFDNIHPYYSFTPEEQTLSVYLQTAWTNFAINGDPNKGAPFKSGWPEWKSYSSDGGAADNFMAFKTPVAAAEQHELEKNCDFWDEMGYEWGVGDN
jgi:cholinesterase